VSVGVLDAHVSVIPPDPLSSFFGGTGSDASRRNAAWMPAAGNLPAGAAKIVYEIKSVERDANKNPVMVFRFTMDGKPVVFNTYAAGSVTELMDNFIGSPSLQFAYAIPQDGVAKPADFNVAPSVYLRTLWSGTGTGASAGKLTFDSTTGYYTATLTGTVIPDNALMLTGGVGYSYSLGSTTPLTQTNVPGYPYGDATVVKGCATGQKCGGLVVTAGDAWKTATGYTARRPIVENGKCTACHEQLGVKPSFHVGQRNDGPTCSFCHLPNRTSGGWSASSAVFVHGIHGAAVRSQDDNWHAACPAGTTFPDTCTKENAAPYYAKVTYPGKLNDCSQCHAVGTNDFSASASAAAVANLIPTTVAAGVLKPDISTSAYVAPLVPAAGTDFGNVFSTSNITSGTVAGTACTTAAPCVCTLAAPCAAADTTLVNSPVTAVCSACHDSANALSHFKMFGGSFYEARSTAKTKTEQCMMCHGPGAVAAIAKVHK
jgi:OmcA/MtrC family decaheme c-type cytochrome